MRIFEKEFAILCRKMFAVIFIAYDICFISAPLVPSKNFLCGMQDIFQAYFFGKYASADDITVPYSIGVIAGNIMIWSMFLLMLHQILYAAFFLVNARKKRNVSNHLIRSKQI